MVQRILVLAVVLKWVERRGGVCWSCMLIRSITMGRERDTGLDMGTDTDN